MYDKNNTALLLWGGVVSSPLGWMYLAVRFFISFLITTLLVIWDLISTIFLIVWRILTDLWPFLIIVAVIFLVLLIIHIFWAEFVDFMNKVFIPLIQIIVDDFIRFMWNDLFVPIYNILVQVWDSLIQLIGFFIYFALNLFLTVCDLIVQIIGKINLPAIFEDLMEIITPLVRLATEILKVFITVGTDILVKFIPIVIAILKIVFEFIKIIFVIVTWLIITLFRALEPLLRLVVAVVRVVTSIFNIRAAAAGARVLLSVNGGGFKTTRPYKAGNKAPDGFGGASPLSDNIDPGEFVVNELYTAASRHYTNQQYDQMFTSLQFIHKGIREEDVFHSQSGYYLEPGGTVPDYARHLYDESDLDEHEKVSGHDRHFPETSKHMVEQDLEEEEQLEEVLAQDDDAQQSITSLTQRQLKEWKGIDTSKLTPEEQAKLEKTKLEFLEALQDDTPEQTNEPASAQKEKPVGGSAADLGFDEKDDAMAEAAVWENFVKSYTDYRSANKRRKDEEKKKNKGEDKHPTHGVKNPLRHEDPYAAVHPDHHWRIDHSRNMTHKDVFPHLRGKKLKRPPLHTLHQKHSPLTMHEKRKRAVAYTHALQHAYYKAYKKHIHNKHLHNAVARSFKHLTGHDDFHDWYGKFRTNYHSISHLLYENIPSTHDKGFFKWMWRADPDYEKRPPFHAWVEKEFNTQNISKDYWKALAEYSQAKEEHEEEHGEGSFDQEMAKRAAARQLKAEFFGGLKINLEILYEDDCFTTPRRNILCLPFIPTNWKIPYVNFSTVVLTKDLNDNPACEPTWKSTDCILCWEGVYNTIQEFRFSLYFLDLLTIIFIFGIFVPRPTEWIGYLGKIFPPLSPIVDLILIYPAGYFPNGQQWACYFINFFYLYEGFIALLIVYYIIDPLWEWFMRSFRSFQALVVVYRLRLAERRQSMEMFDEALLASVNNHYAAAKSRRERNSWGSYSFIRSEIGDGHVSIKLDGARRTESTSPYIDRHRIAEENQELMIEYTRLEMEVEEKRQRISKRMQVLAAKIGAQIIPGEDTPSRQRKSSKIWQFVTSALQMPFQTTPMFSRHLQRYHNHIRENAPPPTSEHFPSPYETLSSHY